MFLEHFGMAANPFGVNADPRFLYFGDAHREALSAVYLSIIEGGGISVLLAEPGMGKTTLLRYLLQRLDGRAAAAFFPHPFRDRRDLMNDVISKVGLSDTGGSEFDQMTRLHQRLAELKRRGYRLVLLFDEVQSLSSEALEQIRLLSNLRSTSHNLLDIVLAGQTEFHDMMEAPERVALRQRVHTVARLGALSADDVAAYVSRRLKVAGGGHDVFEPEALTRVAELSRGVPRSVNRLCHKALVIAWSEDLTRVDEGSVQEAARELLASRGAPKAPVSEIRHSGGRSDETAVVRSVTSGRGAR